jgi:hypothetical protein
MTCPRCKGEHDVLAYDSLMQIEEYAEETAPVYKCPSCRWIFSPSERIQLGTGPLAEVVK